MIKLTVFQVLICVRHSFLEVKIHRVRLAFDELFQILLLQTLSLCVGYGRSLRKRIIDIVITFPTLQRGAARISI